MEQGDSDGEDAMAYFLPNGIADDSPPKPSAMQSSFGPIGGRLGGSLTGSTANPSSAHRRTGSLNTLPTSTSTSGGLTSGVAGGVGHPAMNMHSRFNGLLPTAASSEAMSGLPSSPSVASTQRSFLLSDLRGEIHEPSSPNFQEEHGARARPFAFAGAFRSLGSSSHGDGGRGSDDVLARRAGGIFDQSSDTSSGRASGGGRHHIIGDATTSNSASTFGVGSPSSSGFRPDADPFLPSSSTTVPSGGGGGPLYGRSSAYLSASRESSPFASDTWSSPQPRRALQAPPGLGKPIEESSRYSPALHRRNEDAAGLTGGPPPGLTPRPRGISSPFAAFSPVSSVTSSPFGGGTFGSELQPNLSGIHMASDRFLSGPSEGSATSREVSNRDLAELNAKSMTVEEVQSKLEATAIAAAQEVVAEKLSSIRSDEGFQHHHSPRSPPSRPEKDRIRSHRSVDDRRKGGDVRVEPRSRSSTNRRDGHVTGGTSAQTGSVSTPSRSNRAGGDRRGTATPTRSTASPSATSSTWPLNTTPDGQSKNATRARDMPSTEANLKSRTRQHRDEAASAGACSTPKKKSPSSISSIGSDDQILANLGVLDSVTHEAAAITAKAGKTRESPRESRNANRRGTASKRSVAVSRNIPEKGPTAKRQTPRERQPRDIPKEHGKTKDADLSHAGSDADASGGDSASAEDIADSRKSYPITPKKPKTRNPSTLLSPASHGGPNIESAQEKGRSGLMSPPVNQKKPAKGHKKDIALEEVDNGRQSGQRNLQSPAVREAQAHLPLNQPGDVKVAGVKASSNKSNAGIDARQRSTSPGEMLLAAVPISDYEDHRACVKRCKDPDVVAGIAASEKNRSVSSENAQESAPMVPVTSVHSAKAPAQPASDRKTSVKEHKKDKHKNKTDKKKNGGKNKKEKRDSSSSSKGDATEELVLDEIHVPDSVSFLNKCGASVSTAIWSGVSSLRNVLISVWMALVYVRSRTVDRVNIKGFVAWIFSYLESFLAVIFSVILLLSLHSASWFIRIHRVAFRAILTHRHIGFCFVFLYAFPFLVQYVFPWAPPWAPVCLWYAFLVQLFCTSGPTAMVTVFRILLPLVFLVEGISHHSFLLDMNGAELLLASFILSALKTSNLRSPLFLVSLATQCLSAVFLGSELVVQWFQMALALFSLHYMATSDEDWVGIEDDISCHSMSMHHSISDYNYHTAPTAPLVQKTKRLDRRALAYVRGRKLR